MTIQARWARFLDRRRRDAGYVAVMTALLLTTLMGLAAFAVDVGHWYQVGQQEQGAADAAAMAGVTYLPADSTSAFSTALNYSKINGFQNGVSNVVVTPGLDGLPTRLRVTVKQTVTNFFGSLLGIPTTTVARTAVADYAGPVPMGSPCNGFANDPDPTASTNRSANCTSTSQFWANVGSFGQTKSSGDAYRDTVCASGVDGCTGSVNTDLDPNGYVYTVTVTQPVTNLTMQVFDPAQVDVGDHCDQNNLTAAALLPSAKTMVTDPLTRYVTGDGVWCTGDRNGGDTNFLNTTRFTVHGLGVNAWDPVSWPLQANCGMAPGTSVAGAQNPKDFSPYDADLSLVLNKTSPKYVLRPDVAENFRRWVDLCTISGTILPGTYAIQVQDSVTGGKGGHNRFGLRAFGTGVNDKDHISVAGFNKMAIFANFAGTTQFFLARVPSSAAGQILDVRLFDVGDSPASGHITILPPTGSAVSFTNCKATGSTAALTKSLPDCSFDVSQSVNNGRWQNVAVPIPAAYMCTDSDPTKCWVMLKYDYGASNPADATSWTASIEGDPVRLVE
jgi:Flp pilus assembly protein TadG